ncbi:hypothetical protein BS47DRAFT_1337105 [Hydnum rufescens UP504]|uniref:SAM-dependent methyltransferase Erg6/SMT-type domain-containing protein n=1 Tax=Hydnum rufescens UP504 TaxID=1448309 RepID=A0A9P6B890_9AGAM|nr:hypothetical protein BS47DRAFT_1337105 [Hydnum rufescens UP504]
MDSSKPDGRINSRIENYTKFFEADGATDSKEHTENRLQNYADVVNGEDTYDGATEMYESGWGKSFHFSRFYKGEGFQQSLARHEHYLAAQMGLKPGMRVLDVGCGVGGPAREISHFTDVKIVGINNNAFQVHRARQYTEKAGLSDSIQFVQGDFMALSDTFGVESFDAVYAIEATVHAPSFEGIYGEIYKVLKPGGIFGVYEWVMTDAWDPSIPEHKEIAHKIEVGNGIAQMRTWANAKKPLKQSDLAERPDEVSWYYPLEVRRLAQGSDRLGLFYGASDDLIGIFLTHTMLWFFELLRLVPKGTWDVCEQLKLAADGLTAGGRTKIFTPMALFILRKPGAKINGVNH